MVDFSQLTLTGDDPQIAMINALLKSNPPAAVNYINQNFNSLPVAVQNQVHTFISSGGAPATTAPPPAATTSGYPSSGFEHGITMNPITGAGASQMPLPGYGMSGYNLSGFGIPGFEENMLKGGGSWEGVTWGGSPAPEGARAWFDAEPPLYPDASQTPGKQYWKDGGWVNTVPGVPLKLPAPAGAAPQTTSTGGAAANPWVRDDSGLSTEVRDSGLMAGWRNTQTGEFVTGSPTSNPGAGANEITTTTGATAPGLQINPATPWITTPFLQSYGGRPAPFWDERSGYANINQQIGQSMMGITPAPPTFAWASPERMKAAQPSASGFPPGGWTQMLGFTPGQPANYGFVGGRPNPYGNVTSAVLNPTIGG